MKYIKTYKDINEATTSYYNDEKFIKDIESDIEDIFVDVIDYEYDIDSHLTDYAGNISNITLKKYRDDKAPVDIFLESLHHLYDYVKVYGSYIKDIYVNGKWLESKYRKDNQGRMTWEFIEKEIREYNTTIISINISMGPFNKRKNI